MTADPHRVDLEPAVAAFLDGSDGRSPAGVPAQLPTTEEWMTIDAGGYGALRVQIVRPIDAPSPLPVVVYLPGDAQIVGAATSHDRLVRELSVLAGVAVTVPDCAPVYPLALEGAYAAARWVACDGDAHGLDPSRIAIAGDSVGATLAIATTLVSLWRSDFRSRQLVAFTPATDAACNTASYRTFAEGYHLGAEDMRQHWTRYLQEPGRRNEATACPALTELADLAQFPPSLIVTAEADVVRDEGEAFAARLRLAGTPTTAVRYEGTIHGFVALAALRETSAARAAIAQAASTLAAALHH